MLGGTRQGEPLAFFRSVVENPPYPDECVIWPYAKRGNGYGSVYIDGVQVAVHAAACRHLWGDPPTPQHEVAHGRERRCVSVLCFNPDHLSWKTRIGQHEDQRRDGTLREGHLVGTAKLTDTEALEIYTIWASAEPLPPNGWRRRGMTQQDLADRYGVGIETIGRIVNGKSYRNVTSP